MRKSISPNRRLLYCLANGVRAIAIGGALSAATPGTAAAEHVRGGKTVSVAGTPNILMISPKAKGSVVLLTGGDGKLGVGPSATISDGATNVLIRNRDRLAAHDLNILLVEAGTDLAEAVRMMKRFNLPVTIVATSAGTLRAAEGLVGGARPDRLILTSGFLSPQSGPSRSVMDILGTTDRLPPTLVVHHRQDGCRFTRPEGVTPFMAWAGPRAWLRRLDGGTEGGNPCRYAAHHGFAGQDEELVAEIASFARSAPQRTVALTFDDLPYAGAIGGGPNALSPSAVAALNAKIRETLRRHGVPTTGFVVERTAALMGDQTRPVLAGWTREGLSLANHSYSHADTNALDLAGIEQEIIRGEATIRPLMQAAGRPLRFMRFPMNHTGDTSAKRAGIAAILNRLGYEAAASTIDTSDYVFERAYRVALRQGDAACAANIRRAYIAHSATQIDYYGALSAQVLGYTPPEIALLHLNRLNADTLDDLLALYVARGYRFVTLEEAQSDPAYRKPSTFVSRYGPMWGYRWARERGIAVDGTREAEPPAWAHLYGIEGSTDCGMERPS